MGIHVRPVSEVSDLTGRTNIAGAGINIAQRVMDCGDAGHILLSQRVADDLAQYRQWSASLHDLSGSRCVKIRASKSFARRARMNPDNILAELKRVMSGGPLLHAAGAWLLGAIGFECK